MLQISPQVGGPSQRPARLPEQTEQVLPCHEAKCRLAWQAPSGLLPFTTSPALPTGVNEEHLYKLAPPNGLFDGFGVRTSFFGCGADASKLPDKLIPALWITRDVNGYIMSIGSILRFNDD